MRLNRFRTVTGVLIGCCLLWGTMASAVPTNLAPAGTATASSVGYSLPAANAHNGNRAGGDIWHSANDNVNPAWYQVDLGSDFYLDRVQIIPRGEIQGTVENFTIEVRNSANAVVFSQSFLPANSTDDGGVSPWATNLLRGIVGQTVRITRNDASPDAMTFSEFEVYGQSTPGLANLASGRPVTSTAAGFGTAAANANDGNLDGSYGHGSTYHSDTSQVPWLGHFWQVELEALSEIDYVTLYARGDYNDPANNVRLSLVAADGNTVVDSLDVALGAMDLGATRVDFTHDFAANPAAKFVRVETISEFPLMLTEVEVLGTLVPEPGAVVMMTSMVMLLYGWRRMQSARH